MTSSSPSPRSQWHYHLRAEIEETSIAAAVDGLEGEPLSLRGRLGAADLRRRLLEGQLSVDEVRTERWAELDADVQALSLYASPVLAREILVVPPEGEGAPRLEGWVVMGFRGEAARLALRLRWDAAESAVVDEGEDLEAAARRWADLPEWLKAMLRSKHPGLGAP